MTGASGAPPEGEPPSVVPLRRQLPRSDRGPLVVVLSATDPVAARLGEAWGTPNASDGHVDGSPIRALADGIYLLQRPGPHIHDEHLDQRLPSFLARSHPTLVFPSIHRSGSTVPCLTVHPIGNPGPSAEVGGEPRRLVPTDPARMIAVLRPLTEVGRELGLPVSYEATHHGPALDLPAFFVEIGEAVDPDRIALAAKAIGRILASAPEDVPDRCAIGIGGGHYAPRFTDLALARRWAFGHILSRYALAEMDRTTAEQAFSLTPGAEGAVFAREGDPSPAIFQGIAARLREVDAPRRSGGGGGPTSSGPTASGT